MITTYKATKLRAAGIDQATLDRLIARAERGVRVAECSYNSLVADAPLAYKVAAVRKLRDAAFDLEALLELEAE